MLLLHHPRGTSSAVTATMILTSRSWEAWWTDATTILCPKSRWVSCTPVRTVRIVWRSVKLHRSFPAIVNSAATSCIHIVLILCRLHILLLHYLTEVPHMNTINRNLLADSAQLNYCLPIINGAHFTAKSLILTTSNKDFFALKRIERSLVHVCNCTSGCNSLAICWPLHVLITQDLNVSCLFNKNTVGLLECLVPEENNTLLNVLDDALPALVGSRDNSDNIVWIDGVVFGIYSWLPILEVFRVEALADLNSADVHDLAFFIDDSNGIGGTTTHWVNW